MSTKVVAWRGVAGGVSVRFALVFRASSRASPLPHQNAFQNVGATVLPPAIRHRPRWQASSHRGLVSTTTPMANLKYCGSGLAREEAGHPASPVTDTPRSRASPLPHWICVVTTSIANSKHCVGASLLAMRPGYPTSTVSDTPPSLAGQLPQWICVVHNIHGPHKTLRACSRRRPHGFNAISINRCTSSTAMGVSENRIRKTMGAAIMLISRSTPGLGSFG